MKFENGKYYAHSAGRQIAIVGEAKTTKWGKCLVAEEADRTGHGISCIEAGSESATEGWVEIEKPEWMRNFLPVEEACKGSKRSG